MRVLSLRLLPGRFAVCRLPPDLPPPAWIPDAAEFISVTRTARELSVAAPEGAVPAGVKQERGWRVFEFEGPFEFTVTGILAAAADPLRDAGIGIFAVSTFDTDYLMVKHDDLERAVAALQGAGHTVDQ